MTVKLTNDTLAEPVSFHADMLAYDRASNMGINAGFNQVLGADQTVPAGESRNYTFFAHLELGELTCIRPPAKAAGASSSFSRVKTRS